MPDFSHAPEVFVSEAGQAAAISRAVKKGSLRKLASRLYSRNLTDAPERIVRANLWPIVAAYLPGALVADRTALENRPAADGSIFVVSGHKRPIELPGITIRPRRGHPALDSDRPFIGGLRLSSPARAYLDNMRPSRSRGGAVARTLPAREIEEKLETLLRTSGASALQRIRDDARTIAPTLGAGEEFDRLDALIGALLGTREAALEAPVAIARAKGRPYDPRRLELFEQLRAGLSEWLPTARPAKQSDGPALPFFEAYFSNFIEGTEFAVDEAEAIVFQGRIPAARPEDAHDILGTWKIVSSAAEMSLLPETFEQLTAILERRHATVMEGRPGKGPGMFKTEPNRAGSTMFVAPELVRGTLALGFDIYRGLVSPLHRAIFIMFLIAEVHPFADGNGRMARIMMNAELVAAGECRIMIPSVYRNNYLSALRALSHNRSPRSLIRALDFAQRYTHSIDFSALDGARRSLERTHAFLNANEADAAGIRLTLPA